MKYYKDNDNNIYTFYEDGFQEIETPIFKGKVLKGHYNITQVETKEDASYATYYNEDGTIDWDKENELINSIQKKEASQQKLSHIELLTATVNSVEYDAHTRARGDLSAIVALANFEFIQALVSKNPDMQELYDSVYKSTIDWKGMDNKLHTVQIESIAKAAKVAYEEYAKVIGA